METGGRYFMMAMSRLCEFHSVIILNESFTLFWQVVGLYVEQICLACLFFLKISISRIPSIIDAATMIALLILTIYAHVMIYDSFRRESPRRFLCKYSLTGPIIPSTAITNYLPMTLATRKLAKRYEREKKQRTNEHKAKDDMFGFSRLFTSSPV